MANIYKQNISSGPSPLQITPNQTFGAHINVNAFLRPLAQPLFDTDRVIKSWDRAHIYRLRRSRNVVKMIQAGIVYGHVLTENHDQRPIRPYPNSQERVRALGSGDVVLATEHDGIVRRALILCLDVWSAENPEENCKASAKYGFRVLRSKGNQWEHRIKHVYLCDIVHAYEQAGPEVCMALEAQYSEHPEIKMAGEAQKLPI